MWTVTEEKLSKFTLISLFSTDPSSRKGFYSWLNYVNHRGGRIHSNFALFRNRSFFRKFWIRSIWLATPSFMSSSPSSSSEKRLASPPASPAAPPRSWSMQGGSHLVRLTGTGGDFGQMGFDSVTWKIDRGHKKSFKELQMVQRRKGVRRNESLPPQVSPATYLCSNCASG